MAKTDTLQGTLTLLVLKTLAAGPLHGYAITQRIQSVSEDLLRVEEGSLYPALHRLEESGQLKAQWITKETGRRARIYELTAIGKRQLATEESRWQKITAAITQVLREA